MLFLCTKSKDSLAPCASSASSERSFSTGSYILMGLNKHSLLPETMEVNMRLCSWFRSGLEFEKKLKL